MTASVHELIAECARRGIHLKAAGDRLRWLGPKGALTPDLADRLKQSKGEILQALQSEDNGPEAPRSQQQAALESHLGAEHAQPREPGIESRARPLTEAEEAAICRWLDRIGEFDPVSRRECLLQCNKDTQARDYYLSRAEEASKPLQSEAMALLARDSLLKYGIATDPDSQPDSVIVAIAIRDVGVAELHIPRAKWDPWIFMAFLERQRSPN